MTLSDGTNTLELREDLVWSDRYAWSPVAQSVAHTLSGAAVVETAVRQVGRPITLVADAGLGLVIAAEHIAPLVTWADTQGQVLTLSGLRGEPERTVIFRHQDAPALDLTPLFPDGDANTPDYWTGTIRLMEV